MDKRIRVGAVSYLNTKPLLYGIKRSGLMDEIDLIEEYPSRIASMLVENKIDMGLVPVAVIPKLNQYYIVSDYCIGAVGSVASVCLFSEVPMEKIEKVLLDYQSRTSVNLVKVLLKHYWKKEVELEDAKENFQDLISGTVAGVVIGDRALKQGKKSKYIYDLGTEWMAMTGLPFVFAAWVANKRLDENFIDEFNQANAYGLQHIEEVIRENHFEYYDLNKYYRQNISYELTEEKKKGLKLFLSLL